MTRSNGNEAGDLRDLMVGYQRGDIHAFDELYRRLAPSLRRCLTALARDASWVDDLLQDTFLQLHHARLTYNPAFPVRPWALAIARHVFLMGHRARRRRHGFSDANQDEMDRLSTPGHEHATLARDYVERAFETLSPSTRRAVLLHHGFGFNFKEVGEALHIGETAVKLRVCRAVAGARRRFGDASGR